MICTNNKYVVHHIFTRLARTIREIFVYNVSMRHVFLFCANLYSFFVLFRCNVLCLKFWGTVGDLGVMQLSLVIWTNNTYLVHSTGLARTIL